MLRYISLLLLLVFASNCYAVDASIQKIEVYPLSGGVSINTISFINHGYTGWVTAPSIEMKGRKELNIFNPSDYYNLYLTDVSGSSATRVRTLTPGNSITFKVSSSVHIYVSSNTVNTCEVTEIR
jgi:hypothetical protein